MVDRIPELGPHSIPLTVRTRSEGGRRWLAEFVFQRDRESPRARIAKLYQGDHPDAEKYDVLERYSIQLPPDARGVAEAVQAFAHTVEFWPIHWMRMGETMVRAEKSMNTPFLKPNEITEISRLILERLQATTR